MKAFLFLSVFLIAASVEGLDETRSELMRRIKNRLGGKGEHDSHFNGQNQTDPSLIGKKDGHDDAGHSLIGKKDGHDDAGHSLIGKKDGHDDAGHSLIGKKDGHDDAGHSLIGKKDGHDDAGHSLIGKKDGHDDAGHSLIGKKDGHDDASPSLIGRKDGHDPHNEGPFGKPDGHDGARPKPIGHQDGHDISDPKLIGRPDGHDIPGRKLIGRPDGHDILDRKLIGRPDGHDGGKHSFDNLEDWSYEDQYDEEPEHEPLVRCKRPLCEEVLSCPLGPQTDASGCATCQCLKDPCLEEKCETGYACRPMECPKQGPCKRLEAICQKKKCDGPEPMCATYCPLGYQLNDRGCMTCLCRDPHNLHNLTAEGAKTGDKADDSDEDEDDDYDDDDSLIIEDLDEHLREKEGNEKEGSDDDDDYEDDDEKEGELCEGIRCRRNEICKADWRYPGDSENEKANRICMIKTRCWAVANEPYLYPDHKNPDRRQSCDHTLTFEPLQCLGFNPNVKNFPKSCWCTNDLGYVIDGTVTPIYAEEQKPICERNNTISATVSMKFKVIRGGSGGRTIVEALTKEVSRISFAPKGSINIVNVEYPRTPLKMDEDNFVLVSLIINVHPDYDLPYALDLLFNIKELILTSDLYVVILIGKPTVTSYRFAYPAPPAMEDEDDSDLFDKLDPLPHNPDFHSLEHGYAGSFMTKNLVIMCLVVLSVLILIVLSIIILLARRNCRRGHIRHHQLQNQMSVPMDPEQLLNDPRKNESVVLVTDDVLSKVKDSNVA